MIDPQADAPLKTPNKQNKPNKANKQSSWWASSPDTVAQSIFKVVTSIVTLIIIAFVSWKFHTSCGSEWLVAIVKSIGLQCLAAITLIAIGSPFLYWAKSSLDRDMQAGKVKSGYTSATIGWNIMPWSKIGMIVQQILVLVLFWYFSKECIPAMSMTPMNY